jgi:hypothetical protein
MSTISKATDSQRENAISSIVMTVGSLYLRSFQKIFLTFYVYT